MAGAGYTVSFTNVSKFDYRRSSSGPPSGVLQYQVGNGVFTDITTLAYASSSSSGASLGPVDLSGIAALQNVPAGTNVTFRIVNYAGTGSGGTWYLYDVSISPALDFAVSGSVNPVNISVAAPVITVPPVETNVFAGKNAAFNVTATGAGTLNYQWIQGGVPVADGGAISGAQTNALRFTPANALHAGNYSVIVNNPGGSVTSGVVRLNVAALPILVVSNSPVGFVLSADGGAVSNAIIVQRATNLVPPVTWQPLQTNVIGTNGQIRFTDPNPNQPAGFYRIEIP